MLGIVTHLDAATAAMDSLNPKLIYLGKHRLDTLPRHCEPEAKQSTNLNKASQIAAVASLLRDDASLLSTYTSAVSSKAV